MEQLPEFLLNHPVLTLALFGIAGALAWISFQGAGADKVSPMNATRMINHEDAVILDVRGAGEYDRGHVINAVHIPLAQLAKERSKLNKYKDRPIIAACRNGQQSATACGTLKKNGFQNVYKLQGGMTAWEGADLPTTRK